MERLRKVIASLGVVAILSTLVVTSVANAEWWDTYVDDLVAAGVIDSADDYRAGDDLTRAELVEFAVAAFDLEGTTAIDFSDVPASASYYADLQTAVANGVVKGYTDGTFKPNNPVARAELAKILVEAGDLPSCDVKNPFNDIPSGAWYKDYAVTAYCNSVVDGYSDGSFGGEKHTARAEASKMVSVSMDPVVREDVEEEEVESSELEGGAGSVDQYELLGAYSNEEVGEGQEDVVVYGMTVEASDGSDLGFTAMKLVFDEGVTNGADRDFYRYADEVSIWYEDEEIARVDSSVFTEDNSWTKTVTFDEDAIVRAGDTGTFTVAISGVSNLDSGDADETWDLDVTSLRFSDASGAIISEDPTLDVAVFVFTDAISAADTVMKIALADDSINDAHILNVSSSNTTDNVDILDFTIEIEGDADVALDDLPVAFATTEAVGANFDDVNDIATVAYLYVDGEKVDTESIVEHTSDDATTLTTETDADDAETITFDNLDLTLEAGETYTFTVAVKLISTGGVLDDADTISAAVSATERANIDARVDGNRLTDATEMTGSASADAHAVYDIGFNLDLVSVASTKTFSGDAVGVGDQGQFVIKYDITPFDGDIYIDNTCTEDNDGSEVSTTTSYSVSNDGSNTTSCVMTAAGNVTNSDSANTFLVEEGTSRTFTLTVNVVATADAFAQVDLEAIGWDDATGGDDNVFDFSLPGSYKSDPLYLNLY